MLKKLNVISLWFNHGQKNRKDARIAFTRISYQYYLLFSHKSALIIFSDHRISSRTFTPTSLTDTTTRSTDTPFGLYNSVQPPSKQSRANADEQWACFDPNQGLATLQSLPDRGTKLIRRMPVGLLIYYFHFPRCEHAIVDKVGRQLWNMK